MTQNDKLLKHIVKTLKGIELPENWKDRSPKDRQGFMNACKHIGNFLMEKIK